MCQIKKVAFKIVDNLQSIIFKLRILTKGKQRSKNSTEKTIERKIK